jgi:hypothetical protein
LFCLFHPRPGKNKKIRQKHKIKVLKLKFLKEVKYFADARWNFLAKAKAKLPEGGFDALPTDRNAFVWNDIKADYGLLSLELSALQEARCSSGI